MLIYKYYICKLKNFTKNSVHVGKKTFNANSIRLESLVIIFILQIGLY